MRRMRSRASASLGKLTNVAAPERGAAKCIQTEQCPLFERFDQEPLLRVYKETFCEGRDAAAETCARRKCMMRGNRPPDTLLPDGRHLPELESEQRSRRATDSLDSSGQARQPLLASILAGP